MEISERIRLLRELEAKATRGPWRGCRDGQCPCGYIYGDDDGVFVAKAIGKGDDVDPYPVDEQQNANVKLVAEMRNSLLPLLEYIARLEDERHGFYNTIHTLDAALHDLDTWLQFDKEWADNECLVPLPTQLADWRGTLAKARAAIKGKPVTDREAPIRIHEHYSDDALKGG